MQYQDLAVICYTLWLRESAPSGPAAATETRPGVRYRAARLRSTIARLRADSAAHIRGLARERLSQLNATPLEPLAW